MFHVQDQVPGQEIRKALCHLKVKRFIAWGIMITFACLTVIGVGIFYTIFCENWAYVWCLVTLAAIGIEWIVIHSVYALARTIISIKMIRNRNNNKILSVLDESKLEEESKIESRTFGKSDFDIQINREVVREVPSKV